MISRTPFLSKPKITEFSPKSSLYRLWGIKIYFNNCDIALDYSSSSLKTAPKSNILKLFPYTRFL